MTTMALEFHTPQHSMLLTVVAPQKQLVQLGIRIAAELNGRQRSEFSFYFAIPIGRKYASLQLSACKLEKKLQNDDSDEASILPDLLHELMGWVSLGNETPRSTILLIESSTTCAVWSLLTHSSGNLVLSIRIAAWLNGITNAQNLVAL